MADFLFVIPAKGLPRALPREYGLDWHQRNATPWIPASAGMTSRGVATGRGHGSASSEPAPSAQHKATALLHSLRIAAAPLDMVIPCDYHPQLVRRREHH